MRGRIMQKLSEEEIKNRLEILPDWERPDEKWIQRDYRFDNYLSGIRFVNTVAIYAEEEQKHHPTIVIDYKKVTLKMSSWESKGLTELDFKMAEHFETIYDQAEK